MINRMDKRFYKPRICSLRRKARTKEPTPSSHLFFLPFANTLLFFIFAGSKPLYLLTAGFPGRYIRKKEKR
jgi:hypothetical protein